MMKPPLLFLCAFIAATGLVGGQLLDPTDCGSTHGCWFQPPGCETTASTERCYSGVMWQPKFDAKWKHVSTDFWLQINIGDLQPDFMGKYVALGFSHDWAMGDDSVIECVARPSGEVHAYVSWNDGTHNFRLLQATEAILTLRSGGIFNGRLMCHVNRLNAGGQAIDPNSGRYAIAEKDRFKVFKTDETDLFVLQLARGKADPRSDKLIIHSTSESDIFPWHTTGEKLNLMSPVKVDEMRQYHISRYIQYRFVVAHGVIMLFAWWFFGASAMMLARFFKPVWPTKKLFGTKVWFQLHRDLFVLSVVLQAVAFILIFVQAWKIKIFCTHTCTDSDYAMVMHTLLGIICTILAILQPFIAWARPDGKGKYRPLFNWIHWTVGICAFLLATITIVLAPPLGKAGIKRNYGEMAYYFMYLFIVCYLFTNITLEYLSFKASNAAKIGQSGMNLQVLNGPSEEVKTKRALTTNYNTRIGLLCFFVVTSFVCCAAISWMIFGNLDHH